MSSDVDLCNLALANLGDEATVSSIDPPEGSAQAEHCARFYPMARRTLLEMRGWGFATRRIVLAEAADDPPATWTFAYGLPAQCLKPLAVLSPQQIDAFDIWWNNFINPPINDFQTQPYVVEANSTRALRIYTNVEQAILVYLVDVTDTTKFTPLFELALARLLSSFLAGPIIKGSEGMRVGAAQREFFQKVELPNAAGSDANARQNNPYTTATPDAIAARQ